MTYKGAIKQLYEMRDNILMPEFFKPYFDKIIETMTADVRENVKGEWIEQKPMNFGKCVNGFGSIFICSVCGEEISCCTTKYCPNCGADMRPITALSENAEIDSNLKRGKS